MWVWWDIYLWTGLLLSLCWCIPPVQQGSPLILALSLGFLEQLLCNFYCWLCLTIWLICGKVTMWSVQTPSPWPTSGILCWWTGVHCLRWPHLAFRVGWSVPCSAPLVLLPWCPWAGPLWWSLSSIHYYWIDFAGKSEQVHLTLHSVWLPACVARSIATVWIHVSHHQLFSFLVHVDVAYAALIYYIFDFRSHVGPEENISGFPDACLCSWWLAFIWVNISGHMALGMMTCMPLYSTPLWTVNSSQYP